MSVILGKGFLIDTVDTLLTCPICTADFDASAKMDKAKNPYFKTKCPKCKGKIAILMPMFNGPTRVFELDVPESVQAGETETDFTVNRV